MKDKKNSPKWPTLRFPEFQGEWEEKRLGEVCCINSGKDYKHLSEGEVPVYGSGGIMTYVNDYLYNGDSVGIGRKGTIDCPILLRGKFWTVDTLFYTSDFIEIQPQFLYYIFNRINWKRYNEASGVPSLSKSTLNLILIKIPSICEQSKIVNLLSYIDLRIDTQIKIIEELERLKKGISNLLLNKKKLTKLEPLLKHGNLLNGFPFKSNSYVQNGLYKIITIANVTGERYITTNSCNTIAKLPSDVQPHHILNSNNILISMTGNVGRVSLTTEDDLLLNQRVGLFRVTEPELSEYIYQVLSNSRFENDMISRGQGAAQMNIGKRDIESYLIPVGDKYKMKRIALLLKLFDEWLLNQNKTLATYKQQKSYLLQNLFI